MTWIDGLLIFISILLIYLFFIIILHKKGLLEKYNLGLMGPVLLIKTKKGIGFLKKLSLKKRFWKAYGSSAIVVCFISMLIMVYFFIWQFITLLGWNLTPAEKAQLPGIRFALILPGINPLLPVEYLFYIIVALIVAIIVHEFSHGILTLVGDLKVKAMGLAYLIVPIGAFVEPDEEKLKKTKISKRMRVFAVGPVANFMVVLVCILLFSFVFMASLQPATDGVVIVSTSEDSPAEEYGFKPGMIITNINNTSINSYYDFFIVMNNSQSGKEINVDYYWKGHQNKTIVFADKYEYYEENYPKMNNESYKGKGYFGIGPTSHDVYLSVLKNPFGTNPMDRFIFLLTLPVLGYVNGYNPIVSPFTESYTITGPLASVSEPIFWGITNIIYWIFWINLMVGLFNVIPMLPLDGGYLFNDYLRVIVRKLKKGISEEKEDKIVGNISLFVSLIILFLVLFPFIFKYI